MSTYDKRPVIQIESGESSCAAGWAEVAASLKAHVSACAVTLLAIECYPGIDPHRIAQELTGELGAASTILTEELFLPADILRAQCATALGNDPVFAYMRPWAIADYFDQTRLSAARNGIAQADGLVLVLGAGAAYVAAGAGCLVSANVGRWELQQRQRAHRIGNLGLRNAEASAAELYKVAFFLDWRVGDHCRHAIYTQAAFFLDMTDEEAPGLLAGTALRAAVTHTVHRPFRLVPFFDPGPWGGQWMRKRFDLPAEARNYAWGFDCVPEENSILLGFGARQFALPAIVLVHEEPEALLGPTILKQFGAEFPIRFDFLDTVDGGNLSLQVHPSSAYIREHFGMAYTQDESYYMLHAEPGASMYLGLREGVDREPMEQALHAAQAGEAPFDTERFIAAWPTATHDHFSIPAGTVHCSGTGNVVLEISATPYIFTFKLWDWGRAGLDGRPRPIHLEHGLANICWERTAGWVARELVDQAVPVASGDGWREERTGLHATEFLETRRHWFTAPVPHRTDANLQVMNLVEGDAVSITSPTHAFAPCVLHYGETLVLPASVGAYTVEPAAPAAKPLATLKAYVRPAHGAAEVQKTHVLDLEQ